MVGVEGAQIKTFNGVQCTESYVESRVRNDECYNTRGFASSVKVDCASSVKGSSWELIVYSSIDCNDSGNKKTTMLTGQGTDCALASGEAGDYYVRIDCSIACFSDTAYAKTMDGRDVAVADLDVGDMVLASAPDGTLFYDRVFRVSHNAPEQEVTFLRLTLETGQTLEISPDHYLHVATCCSVDELTLASAVSVGDVVFAAPSSASAGDALKPAVVVAVEEITKRGAFNVHVLGGNLVVNGVAASHFTVDSAWRSNKLATVWYRAVDAFSHWTGVGKQQSRAQARANQY